MELEQLVKQLTRRVEILEEENKDLKKRQGEVEGMFKKTQEVMTFALQGTVTLKRAVEKAMDLIRKR